MDAPPPYTSFSNPKSVDCDYGQPIPSYPVPPPQQQQVIVVQPQVAPTFAYLPHPVSMTGALVLSCVVFWCFGWLFGGIAFILALIGSDSSQNGDVNGAIRLRNASYGVSIAGFLIGIIVIIIVVCYASSSYKHY